MTNLPGSTAGDTPSDLEWLRVWRSQLKLPEEDLKVIDWMIEKLDRATWLLLERALKDSTEKKEVELWPKGLRTCSCSYCQGARKAARTLITRPVETGNR